MGTWQLGTEKLGRYDTTVAKVLGLKDLGRGFHGDRVVRVGTGNRVRQSTERSGSLGSWP